jgi:hypothetical protein
MILTTKYGLKKPEDTDLSDLRIFVGDNMEILDGHGHDWADITTGKPTEFTPPLSSATVRGGHRVGNGLRMTGEYLTVREGAGINVSDTNYSVEVDRTQTDAWYVQNAVGQDLTLWKGTQADYDLITTPDPNTLYFIVG